MHKILKPALFAGLLLFLCQPLAGQKKVPQAGALSEADVLHLHAMEDTLAVLAYAVVNDSFELERFAACKVLITKLVATLKTPNSFHYRFDRLKSISILAPPDSSFRIFTWQLFVNDSTYRYYGAIQMNSSELKLFPLVDRSFDLSHRPVSDRLPPDRWYGALYYNILPLSVGKKEKQYLLFGYDAYSFFDKRKVLEVLTFGEDGVPVFGAPVFNRQTPEQAALRGEECRIILEYTAETSIRLNWDEQYQMILYEHLIPMPSPFNRGVTYVPDGSYEGFRIEKGKLQYVEKVFNQVSEEAPRPEPILDRRQGKDVMGRTKKN
jgi:hypothetical protein